MSKEDVAPLASTWADGGYALALPLDRGKTLAWFSICRRCAQG